MLGGLLLALPAHADENDGHATVTASITTISPQTTIRADDTGRCWIGDMEVDCITQDYIDRAVRVAAMNETAPRSTPPRASGE